MSSVCRSSGILVASDTVSGERSRLVSVHCQRTGAGAPTTVRLFDNASAASGKELIRIILDPTDPASPPIIEMDLHGVICSNGIFLDISTGTGTGAAVAVHFS
mgnify:CR=1 FL=1|tara:strand:+ start:1132 stop:1440 length:309 start_codon:yes stop_codon:yes gene_type:complete